MAGLESDRLLGNRFRAAREARGLTLSEVAEQIRIRSVYLSAIEEENWPAIGAPVYVRGFLRTYARFLGLDPEEAVTEFRSRAELASSGGNSVTEEAAAPTVNARAQNRTLSPLIWIASLVAVALIAFVVYEVLMPQRTFQLTATGSETPGVSSSALASASSLASATPASGPTANAGPQSLSPSPGSAGRGSLQVVVAAPSWLRVSVDGSVRMLGTFPAGTNRIFRGKSIRMRVGNAGGVAIYLDGKSLGILGKSGAVVDRAFTL